MARTTDTLLILGILFVLTVRAFGQPCLSDQVTDRKQFFHLGMQREVLISTRGRQGESRSEQASLISYFFSFCRLIANVFAIFAEEVLGYQTKLLLTEDGESSYDEAAQFSRLSTCQDPL